MSGNHNFSSESRRSTPWDNIADRTPTQEFLFKAYNDAYKLKHPDLSLTGEDKLINSFVPKACPYEGCGSEQIIKFGLTDNGIERYKCNACGRHFTPVTGTIFDNHKISVTDWVDYLLNLFRYVSLTAGSWDNKNAFTTSRYWLEKVFLLLRDYYSSTAVLSGHVYLDETYYSVRKGDKTLKSNGTEPKGLSINQICIGVACTSSTIVCAIEGRAKPSKRKVWNAFGHVIAPGSKLTHDGENAHKILLERLNLKDDPHKFSETKGLEDAKNPLRRVNRVHAQLKKFLYAHSSFNREYLQGYLDLFSFIMNPPKSPLEKIDLLLNLAFEQRQTLRYRDVFSKPRDDEDEVPF